MTSAFVTPSRFHISLSRLEREILRPSTSTISSLCSKENREVPWDEVVRGYEVQKGKYIIITPKELEALELQSGRLVEVFQFVDADKLDAVYFDSSYYLIPDEHGEKPYYLMREALE